MEYKKQFEKEAGLKEPILPHSKDFFDFKLFDKAYALYTHDLIKYNKEYRKWLEEKVNKAYELLSQYGTTGIESNEWYEDAKEWCSKIQEES